MEETGGPLWRAWPEDVPKDDHEEENQAGIDVGPGRPPDPPAAERAVQGHDADDGGCQQGQIERQLKQILCQHIHVQGHAPAEGGHQAGVTGQQ